MSCELTCIYLTYTNLTCIATEELSIPNEPNAEIKTKPLTEDKKSKKYDQCNFKSFIPFYTFHSLIHDFFKFYFSSFIYLFSLHSRLTISFYYFFS